MGEFFPKLMPMKTTIRLALTVLSFLCLAAAGPKAQAVSPAPDGGYPGGNTAEGQAALLSLTTGGFNTAVGFLSLRSDTTGPYNTAVGAGALLANTADLNTATGAGSLLSNTTGSDNTANGGLALFSNITGYSNTATGAFALFSNTGGHQNTALGVGALFNNISGNGNTAAGINALLNNTTGNGNTVLGVAAGGGITTANNVICIGTDGNNVDNSCFIGNIFGSTSVNGVGVLVNSNGRLGTMTSSRRFKEEIKPMDQASEALFALKPVTFRYKKEIDRQRIPQFGLVAEDVEKVDPDLVARDEKGKPYSVRYDQVNAMLLNEFLKAHGKMEEQQRQIQALTVQLKEQAAQIQKVSARLEVGKPAPQMACLPAVAQREGGNNP
ncbi:MAG: hypothetical protein DME61_02085 [Verrucomicrobia bacterium]|nr:MAG: hypothetical protein DME61_02085 [Verrucomicrobiota bacterium]